MRSIIDWLEHRTGLETAIKEFLERQNGLEGTKASSEKAKK